MNMEEMQKECEKRAFDLIQKGGKLNEITLRVIARQVIKEAMEGKANENSVSV
jgi:hypothetical protein